MLIVGHGSRAARANEEFERLVRAVQERAADVSVERAYIELAAPSLDEGIDAAVRAAGNRGAVTVVPYILSRAGHVKVDIADAVARGVTRHREVSFTCAPHLGAHPAVVALLAERALTGLAGDAGMDATLLFATRGTSDPEARAECEHLAVLVGARAGFGHVTVGFMGVARPDVPEALDACGRAEGITVVLPHLLNDGTLSEKLRARWVPEARGRNPRADYRLADVMAPDDRLTTAVLERGRTAG